jgi:hypothetical protein
VRSLPHTSRPLTGELGPDDLAPAAGAFAAPAVAKGRDDRQAAPALGVRARHAGLQVVRAVLARRADGPVPTWFEDWLQAEGEAQSLRIWSPTLIPGLLQPPTTRGRCSWRNRPTSRTTPSTHWWERVFSDRPSWTVRIHLM